MSKPKRPPPEQLPLFDAPQAPRRAPDDPRRPDYRPLWEPRPEPLPFPTPTPTPAAPAQRHSRTSVEAARLMSGTRAGSLRATIYRWLLERGAHGATDEEGQGALGMEGNTYRPRRIELQEAGLVAVSTAERLTKSKRWAAVWIAVPPEEEEPRP